MPTPSLAHSLHAVNHLLCHPKQLGSAHGSHLSDSATRSKSPCFLVLESTGLGNRQPGFESQPQHFLAMVPWASHIADLSFGFFRHQTPLRRVFWMGRQALLLLSHCLPGPSLHPATADRHKENGYPQTLKQGEIAPRTKASGCWLFPEPIGIVFIKVDIVLTQCWALFYMLCKD